MDRNWQLRQTCIDAIRQCEQAELKAKQSQQAAARQRQAALSDARRKHGEARQRGEALLKAIREMVRRGDEILADVSLTPGPAAAGVAAPSQAGLDELNRALRHHHAQARQSLTALEAAARELEEERRKWWKFW